MYVDRNKDGKIISIYARKQYDGQEFVDKGSEELELFFNPPLTPFDRIVSLEAEITPRRIREAVLGIDGGWLENQDALIAAERAKL